MTFTDVWRYAFTSGAAALLAVGHAGAILLKVALAALANNSALGHILKRENMKMEEIE
jgi:hypothetical protein